MFARPGRAGDSFLPVQRYTGSPNRLTSGRDVPGEVVKRLRQSGFLAQAQGDGVLAVRM